MRIDDFVVNVNSIIISGHVKPDGDCVGSVLALYSYLIKNYPEKCVDVVLEEPNGKLNFLKNFDKINSSYEPVIKYDLCFCLDCATYDRLGKATAFFDNAEHTISIDHHVSNTGFADDNYIYGDMSSASEALFNFLDYNKIDRDIAICLYTGIIYDTGVFKYPLTSPDTMRTAAALMEFGIPADYIIDESFYSKTYNENRILGYAVMNSVLEFDGRVIHSMITKEEMDRFGVTTKDMEGIVPQLRLTKGVVCAVFMYETGVNEYKVSLRSTGNYDVNAVASVFGGGGHVRASGCTVHGEAKTCMEALLIEIGKSL